MIFVLQKYLHIIHTVKLIRPKGELRGLSEKYVKACAISSKPIEERHSEEHILFFERKNTWPSGSE